MGKAVRYRFTVWATVALDNADDGLAPIMTAKETERQIHKLLVRSDADCDVEFQDQEVIEE